MTQAGVDGCLDGWLCVMHRNGKFEGFVEANIEILLKRIGEPAIVALDLPIGITERGTRQCDQLVRKLLGRPRGSSVFPTPVRSALKAQTYTEACELHEKADGRRISKQNWGILGKIHEVDLLLKIRPRLRGVLHEVHPEFSFACWNENQPMADSKKTSAGRQARENLIDAHWPGLRSMLSEQLPKDGWATDDLNDALAALWSAERIAAGRAIQQPNPPEQDRFGIPMTISA